MAEDADEPLFVVERHMPDELPEKRILDAVRTAENIAALDEGQYGLHTYIKGFGFTYGDLQAILKVAHRIEARHAKAVVRAMNARRHPGPIVAQSTFRALSRRQAKSACSSDSPTKFASYPPCRCTTLRNASSSVPSSKSAVCNRIRSA